MLSISQVIICALICAQHQLVLESAIMDTNIRSSGLSELSKAVLAYKMANTSLYSKKTAIMDPAIIPASELSKLSNLLNEIWKNWDVPTYLQKLLIWTGFDKTYSIAMMTAEDVAYMEQFARDILAARLNTDERDSFSGIFSKNLDAFRIVPGHVKILLILIDRCKKRHSAKHY